MCFHTSAFHKIKKVEKRFEVKLISEQLRPIFDHPNYHLNGFSHPNMLVIPQEKSDVLAPGVWGIVPTNKNVCASCKNALLVAVVLLVVPCVVLLVGQKTRPLSPLRAPVSSWMLSWVAGAADGSQETSRKDTVPHSHGLL